MQYALNPASQICSLQGPIEPMAMYARLLAYMAMGSIVRTEFCFEAEQLVL